MANLIAEVSHDVHVHRTKPTTHHHQRVSYVCFRCFNYNRDGNYQAGCCHMVRINQTISSTCYRKARNEYQQRFFGSPSPCLHWRPGTACYKRFDSLVSSKWDQPSCNIIIRIRCSSHFHLHADPSTCGNHRNQYLKLPTTSPFSPFFLVLVVFLYSLVSAQCSYIALC